MSRIAGFLAIFSAPGDAGSGATDMVSGLGRGASTGKGEQGLGRIEQSASSSRAPGPARHHDALSHVSP